MQEEVDHINCVGICTLIQPQQASPSSQLSLSLELRFFYDTRRLSLLHTFDTVSIQSISQPFALYTHIVEELYFLLKIKPSHKLSYITYQEYFIVWISLCQKKKTRFKLWNFAKKKCTAYALLRVCFSFAAYMESSILYTGQLLLEQAHLELFYLLFFWAFQLSIFCYRICHLP